MAPTKKTKKQQVNKRKSKKKQQQNEEEEEVIDYQLDSQPTFWDLIAPEGISIKEEDRGVIKQSLGSKTHFRPLYIPREGYPRKLQTNWLNSMFSSGEVDVLVDIHKVNKSNAMRSLQKQMTMLQSNLSWQQKRGNIDSIQEYRTKIQDTEILMEEIQFSENDMFMTSVMATLYAEDEKALNRYSEALDDEFNGKFFTLATAFSRVKDAFRSTLPIGKNYLKDTYRNIDRRALSTFGFFTSGSGRYIGGVPIGINMIEGHLEFINSFGNEEYKPQNYNMGIFGIPGSGKSLAMKLKIAREMAGGNVWAVVIDPEGEFRKLTRRMGGINLDISEESDVVINPCSINFSDVPLDDKDSDELELLYEDDEREVIEREGRQYLRFVPVREKLNELLDFFDIIVRGKDDRGLDVFERDYLEKAISYVYYELHKITTHPDSLFQEGIREVDGQLIQSQVRKPEPELMEIYNILEKQYGEEPRSQRLLAAMRPFLRTGSKPIFDGQTNLGRGVNQSLESSRLVNFNISDMEEGFLRPVAFHVLLNYSWEYFAKNSDNATKKKFIYSDEIWQFVDNEQTVSFYERLARRSRKRNCGLVFASQDFVRLLENKKARGIVTSTFTTLFMQQNTIDLAKIKENFDLTDGEIDILFGNPAKGEGILRYGDNRIWLRTNPSEDELTFIESNEAVLQEREKRKKLLSRQG
ncbi:helicase HerA domain-containing protein [Pontibacillus halophilus]|uniref:VirB4 family type IV secretion system protein n=1 Tax=Pontibacillus halophilus TaxID=516704 RepID=UPI00041904BA